MILFFLKYDFTCTLQRCLLDFKKFFVRGPMSLYLRLPKGEPQRRRDEGRELGEEDAEPEQDDEVRPAGEALLDEGLPHHRHQAAGQRHEGVPPEGQVGAGLCVPKRPEPDAGVDGSQDGRAEGVGVKIGYFEQLFLRVDSMDNGCLKSITVTVRDFCLSLVSNLVKSQC